MYLVYRQTKVIRYNCSVLKSTWCIIYHIFIVQGIVLIKILFKCFLIYRSYMLTIEDMFFCPQIIQIWFHILIYQVYDFWKKYVLLEKKNPFRVKLSSLQNLWEKKPTELQHEYWRWIISNINPFFPPSFCFIILNCDFTYIM